MNPRLRAGLLALYAVLAIGAAFALPRLTFAFDFASFFPQDDPDLEFFQEFVADFEADDNFLLIAVEAPRKADGGAGSVFDTAFLNRFHAYTLAIQDLPQAGQVMSLTKFRQPLKTPFGITSTPAVHRDDPTRLPYDSVRIMSDERFLYNFISPDASTLALVLRTEGEMTLGASDSLMAQLRNLTANAGFGNKPKFSQSSSRIGAANEPTSDDTGFGDSLNGAQSSSLSAARDSTDDDDDTGFGESPNERESPSLATESDSESPADAGFGESPESSQSRSPTSDANLVEVERGTTSAGLLQRLGKLLGFNPIDELGDGVHYLGRAYFQSELIQMQKREVAVSTLVSGLLVTLILFFIYRRWRGVLIAMGSIALGLLLFMGLLAATGRELNAMSALYPVLMVIVGTSDLIHLMTKYVDELRKGKDAHEALRTTIREIGLATFLTSATTAIGFVTLLTSRVEPIRDFGLNAGIGVIIAYITVMTFTLPLLTLFSQDQLMQTKGTVERWDAWLVKLNAWVFKNNRPIVWGTLATTLICAIGISLITTNYRIIDNLPRGSAISEDFEFFEQKFTGFRPVEYAVFVQAGYSVNDLPVLREIDKLESAMRAEPALRAVTSQTMLVKSVQQAMAGGSAAAYRLPEDSTAYARILPLIERMPMAASAVLVSKDGNKARITSRALDIGSDSLRQVTGRLAAFAKTQLDSSVIKVRETGTGLLLDKNSIYVRESLLWGLGGAIVMIAGLMALVFMNWKLLIISLIPNLVPLIFCGALLGYLGIELEAGISIIFAVIFGIAVDDTIHFLAKYRLVRGQGHSIDESMEITFRESGKAIILTTVILFFGFLVMLFSVHPPSVTVGLLISVTLVSALIADVLLLPVLLRAFRV